MKNLTTPKYKISISTTKLGPPYPPIMRPVSSSTNNSKTLLSSTDNLLPLKIAKNYHTFINIRNQKKNRLFQWPLTNFNTQQHPRLLLKSTVIVLRKDHTSMLLDPPATNIKTLLSQIQQYLTMNCWWRQKSLVCITAIQKSTQFSEQSSKFITKKLLFSQSELQSSLQNIQKT